MWTDATINEDFHVTSIGSREAFVTVKEKPSREFLEEHKNRKAKLSVEFIDKKRVYGSFRREF